MPAACRCGWDGTGDHPCHRCLSAPGTRRLVVTGPTALAGTQTKLGAYETWGCDPCWEDFRRANAAALESGHAREVG